MDIVKDPRVDWVGMKWIFIGVSLVLIGLGVGSILIRGLNLGIDFTGGTLVYVKFREQPQIDRVRSALGEAGIQVEQVSRFGQVEDREIQIKMATVESEQEQDLSLESSRVVNALQSGYSNSPPDAQKVDLNNASSAVLSERLQQLDPEKKRETLSITEFSQHYQGVAERITDLRTDQGGVFQDMAVLSQVEITPAVLQSLQDNAYLGDFSVMSVESVGPKVGREMQERALNAVLFSLLGMLVYIAFRFKPIYGFAAIVAIFHDVFITVGAFSLTGREVSLTVIAALLTLVGYSINDTIVIFDRVRENLRGVRRPNMTTIFNESINQTLNRTIMTSGATFLAVTALYVVGGEALSGFSFALVIGIIIGTYSSVSIASPIVIWWQNYQEKRKAAVAART